MQEQVVYEMVCAMLRERWGAAESKPKLRLVGGTEVKNPAPSPEVCQAAADQPRLRPTRERLLAWPARHSG